MYVKTQLLDGLFQLSLFRPLQKKVSKPLTYNSLNYKKERLIQVVTSSI